MDTDISGPRRCPSSSVPRSQATLSALLMVTLAIFCGGRCVRADSPGRELQKHVPQIIQYLNERSLKNVGVLKFRVKKDGDKTSDHVGPLNSLLADRLEVGLILANPFDSARQLNIIRNAGAQAAKIEGAGHLNAEGRARFFGPQFDAAWGNKKLLADAFLTGVVQVHPDNKTITVGILCFDRTGSDLEKACDVFEATLDAASLSEIGESFVLRGAFDGGKTQLTGIQKQEAVQQEVLQQAAAVRNQLTSFPLKDDAAPVRLEITYDGKPVPIETREGRAFIAEPRQNQKVELAIVRTNAAKGSLGIVVKVNGENTLYRQTTPDLICSKWILSDEHQRTVIRGYQAADGNTAEEFRVLSDSESAERSVDYGRHVGQIQMTVFKQEDPDADDLPPALADEDEEDLVAMLRGTQPSARPQNLSALKHQLRTAGRDETSTRGLIVQGQQTTSEIKAVRFAPDPTPVMSVTITYYKPN
ncbi:MAG: hypothetical protein KDA89_24245 [Planctomycetaceae bacterium]|nr:hypothetical protein [Planctomycetaceae bacterium]